MFLKLLTLITPLRNSVIDRIQNQFQLKLQFLPKKRLIWFQLQLENAFRHSLSYIQSFCNSDVELGKKLKSLIIVES